MPEKEVDNHRNTKESGEMDLTTRQRPVTCEGKTGRMAKSIFSIRSLMDVAEDTENGEYKSRRYDGKLHKSHILSSNLHKS